MSLYFIATYTLQKVPLSILTPTIDIYRISDKAQVVAAQDMMLIASGGYVYDFTSLYDSEEAYYGIADAGTDTVDYRYVYGCSLLTTDQVYDQIYTLMAVDMRTSPAQGSPPQTTTPLNKLDYLYKCWNNKVTETGGQASIYNDAGDTIDHKATTTDLSGVVTRDKWGSGP